MLSHLLERIQPTHVLVAFDAGKTTFRTEMYADYKGGGRQKHQDEFREQFPFIREQLDHLIRHYELAQYEEMILLERWTSWQNQLLFLLMDLLLSPGTGLDSANGYDNTVRIENLKKRWQV